jgi:hypothetical protein
VVAVMGVWWSRARREREEAPPPAVEAAQRWPSKPRPRPEPLPATNLPATTAFHWSQIESNDYRQYIANLRAVGCPERLIRDVVVADLHQLYERRRQSVRAAPLPPWADQDARAAAETQAQHQLEALDEEHRAVLRELLGFAWNREAIELWNNEEIAWLLLGFLTDDQAIRVAGLVEPLQNSARRLRDRVEGILLAEDCAALEQLGARFRADVAAWLTPQQTEEFNLRLQALGLAISGKGLHFDLAGLTGLEGREIVRLSLAHEDFIREELLGLEPSEAERQERRLDLDHAVANVLGPQKYAAFARAQDERFREAYEFTHERQLPEDSAVKAWEIRRVAEEEAAALRAGPAAGTDSIDLAAQLQALQESAAAALTSVLGVEHADQYVEQHGEWLKQIGQPPGANEPGGQP